MTQIPIAAQHVSAGPLPRGSRLLRVGAGGEYRVVAGEFSAAGFADVAFDGRRLLFVGREDESEPAGVWETPEDADTLRRVTDFPGECLRAIYLPAIYTIDAEKPVDQIAFLGLAPGSSTPAVFTCELDGSHLRQITFAPLGVTDPFLLSDGRLVISMTTESDTGANSSLFTINTDGTDLFPFAALQGRSARRTSPCQLPDDRLVFVESAFTDDDTGGTLRYVQRTHSLDPPAALALNDTGLYRSPTPGTDDSLMASYRADASASYGVVRLDPSTGRRVGTVFDDPAWHDLGARVIRARTRPPGRSSVVDDRMNHGQLYCLDAYLTDLDRTGPGTIKTVRIRQRTPDDTEAAIGEAPVADDGSFFVELPARTPFRLETLDSEGAVIQAMRTWMWIMPNERRGCIGCHEDRSLTPPNRHVLALRRRPYRLEAAPPPAPIAAHPEGAAP